jgi:hypothetical protein
MLAFDNHLPEDGHCRPKHVGGVSYIFKLLSFYCCAGVAINIVKYIEHLHLEYLHNKENNCFSSTQHKKCLQWVGHVKIMDRKRRTIKAL